MIRKSRRIVSDAQNASMTCEVYLVLPVLVTVPATGAAGFRATLYHGSPVTSVKSGKRAATNFMSGFSLTVVTTSLHAHD